MNSPSSELFLRDKLMPHVKLRALLGECLGYKHRLLIENAYVENSEEIKINLRETSGCSGSKNRYTDFHAMKVRGVKNYEEALKIEKKIFHGGHDCIARKGKNARVYSTNWDKGKWFCNAGGSHRAAALWQYDTKNNIDRIINCDLITVKISDLIQNFAREYSIWICRPNYYLIILFAKKLIALNKTLKKEVEINLLEFKNSSILISKHSSLNIKVSKMIGGKALNISEWLLNPTPLGYNKDYCLDINSQLGLPATKPPKFRRSIN